MSSTRKKAYRIVMFEVNEISWELMEHFFKQGRLRNFQKLKKAGAIARTVADETFEFREPWVTWTTLFTGVPQSEHKMVFLEQPPETIGAKSIWDHLSAAGKRVGVFGSVGSWPPKKVDGFFVPGSFSPDSQTHPENLRPIQDLNLTYTRAHVPGKKQPSVAYALAEALRLFKLGLDIPTLSYILKVMAEIKLNPVRAWKKVSLQPVLNLSFFRKLVNDMEPDFATFHTNHVAHYQHRFFRAWKPELFPDSTSEEEKARYHDSIGYGYEVADKLLGTFMEFCERKNVILCVASSLGQQPYIPARYDDVAPETCRIKSIERLISILGLEGKCEYFSTMAPQWNIKIQDPEIRRKAIEDITAARYQPLDKTMYSQVEVGITLVITPISLHGLDSSATCVFPTRPGAPVFPFDELVIQADETRKSGCHHPIGMLAFFGAPVRSVDLDQVNNLDIAPTLMDLVGLEPHPRMKGKVISREFLHTEA